MGARVLVSIMSGNAAPETWQQAAREEPRCRGKASACSDCPLRIGGAWEPGATAALEAMSEAGRAKMKRWGCHASERPCAGMRRLLRLTEPDSPP
jgi:hypothetical protein